ncbi:MAG: hypothetical protein ACTTJS_05540 [Wolinella sp.]
MQETIEICSDVSAALKRLAKKHKIPTRKIDFELLGVNTFLVRGRDDLQRVNNSVLFDIAYSPYGMKQFYKVKFFLRSKELEPFLLTLRSDEEGTSLSAIVMLDRLPPLDKNFIPLLKELVQKRMALDGYMLGLGGKKFDEEAARFLSMLLRKTKFDKASIELKICELKRPEIIKPVSLKLLSKPHAIGHLVEQSELLTGAILKVSAGETLLRYRKPTYKSPWRNCKGEWFGDGNYPISIAKGDGLEWLESEEIIEYRAEKDGFASIADKKLSVLDMPVVESVDFKMSKSLADLALDKLQIINDDNLSDAIGQGVELEIPTLLVKGNVGPAIITAKELKINGQIHARAILIAEYATLLFLKGSLKAESAQVKFCETAHLIVEKLRASYLGGTTAFFEDAEIERLGSNNTLHVGVSLRVNKVMGRGNTFSCDPLASKKNKHLLSHLNHQRELLEEIARSGYWREKELVRERDEIMLFLDEIREREYSNNVLTSAVRVELEKEKNLQQNALARCERILKAISTSKERLETIKSEIMELKESVLNIVLNFDEGIGNENTVLFKLPNDSILEFIPPFEVKSVYLVANIDGGYEVRYKGGER